VATGKKLAPHVNPCRSEARRYYGENPVAGIEEGVLSFHCARRGVGANWGWLKEMLTAAFILVMSMAALIQFAAFTWRAAFLSLATAELPESVSKPIELSDFREASVYEKLCPELGMGGGMKLGSVGVYHRMLQVVTSVGERILPPAAGWAEREMALCARYATVALAQRRERNQLVAAELTSF
jgi:hypothetical protein